MRASMHVLRGKHIHAWATTRKRTVMTVMQWEHWSMMSFLFGAGHYNQNANAPTLISWPDDIANPSRSIGDSLIRTHAMQAPPYPCTKTTDQCDICLRNGRHRSWISPHCTRLPTHSGMHAAGTYVSRVRRKLYVVEADIYSLMHYTCH
jgi:hypothetical protein